ncbi:MAG: hypothetical protein K9N55_21455 [Phycisphaerae bacterium]|nr:hypothetical protein [Phycisphaerae bacterium]
MCKKLIYLCMCMLVLALAGSNAALGETADIQIAAGTDDAEQHLGDARMDIGSTDLEFAYEDGGDPTTDEQVVGLRFVGIPLDPGAFVMDTYIEIEVDKVDKEGSQAPVNVIIEGQLALDASEFVDDANNITDRPTTTAKVMWSIPEWTEESAKFQSPDLSSIIQEIIDQEGWTSGNAIVLIIRDDKDNPSTGLREAESFEGEAGAAALLHLDYAIPVIFETRIADELDDAEEDLNPSKLGEMDETSSDLELAYEDDNMGDPQLVGVRFREIAIPANSPITEAWVRFQVKETRSGTLPVNLIIEGQLDLNPDAFSGGGPGTFNISSRPRTVASIQWSVPSWENVGDSGAAQTTVNIAPIIQELVNQDGWASGNALVLIFSDDPCNPSEGLRNAHAGVGNDSALLHIEAIIDIATNPEPANGAVGVLLGSTLSWKPIPVGATREVYFGTTNPPALVSVQEGTSYYPGPIDPNTTYYWQVDEVEADGTTVHAGDIWSFTTGLSNLRTDTGIADENDDGEDHIAHGDAVDDGAESRGSSDLEMPWDNDEPDLRQVVGLRFRDMPIPQGAPITEAYVQFTADNENLDGGPVNLIISGLLVPDTGALGGGENFFERGPKTVAEVAWTDIPEWTSSQATAASRTPDISSIIQEIVNQDGWAPGNAIMLFIRDDETNPSADNRSALSMSAVLHVPVSNSVPTQPSPANGAEEVPVDTMLNWCPGLDAVSHEV